MDTIFAEATPPGRGGVSVIRISGPQARAALEDLAGPMGEPRMSAVRALRDGDDLIDRALVIWFAKGHSFTGEEIAELHLHGAPVIANRVSDALLARGLRRAEAGEFTRRAFMNGRMDLAEAEGLADLLSAETEAQRQLAMKSADGELGRKVASLRSQLIRAGALIEASIDFADEEVPEEVPEEVFELIQSVRSDLQQMLTSYPATERLRQGYEVAIIGPPNAGKSTLLNRIAQREVALVSDVAGTTRDIIELRTDLRGLAVTFLDTAGLRDSDDAVEAMGVERAKRRSEQADIRVHLCHARPEEPEGESDLYVVSKSDLRQTLGLSVSGMTGAGVEQLLDLIYDKLRARAANASLVGHKRQADAMQRALDGLSVSDNLPPEILAESLRRASTDLAAMVGKIGAEDYLDEVFSSFCIGK